MRLEIIPSYKISEWNHVKKQCEKVFCNGCEGSRPMVIMASQVKLASLISFITTVLCFWVDVIELTKKKTLWYYGTLEHNNGLRSTVCDSVIHLHVNFQMAGSHTSIAHLILQSTSWLLLSASQQYFNKNVSEFLDNCNMHIFAT